LGKRNVGQFCTYVEELTIQTQERYQILCITEQVEKIVAESNIIDGLVLVNPMHITASCYVNDLERGLGPEYQHHRTGEDNGDAHLKRQLLGQQVTMPVQDGRLHLGTWEQIHYAEFDGQRPKRILVKVIGIQRE